LAAANLSVTAHPRLSFGGSRNAIKRKDGAAPGVVGANSDAREGRSGTRFTSGACRLIPHALGATDA
jgi:hypothetical protein